MGQGGSEREGVITNKVSPPLLFLSLLLLTSVQFDSIGASGYYRVYFGADFELFAAEEVEVSGHPLKRSV